MTGDKPGLSSHLPSDQCPSLIIKQDGLADGSANSFSGSEIAQMVKQTIGPSERIMDGIIEVSAELHSVEARLRSVCNGNVSASGLTLDDLAAMLLTVPCGLIELNRQTAALRIERAEQRSGS